MRQSAPHTASAAESLALHRDYMLPALTTYYDEPLVLVEGSGTRVWDADGREYLDAFAGILTTSLGHCHPRIVEAVRDQAGRLGHTSSLYITEPMLEAARRLAGIAPGELRRTFFSGSGSEANDTAIAMARAYTGRIEVIALRGAYHGRTGGSIALTAHSAWRVVPSTQAGVTHAVAPYPYRCPLRQPCDERCGEAYAKDLEEVILTTTNGRPAAFVVEPIQGVNGVVVPPPGYLRKVAEVIRRYGGLLIVDEVQTGFGRTGGAWFGIEHAGVVPDIMVTAKGIAGGLPVSATTTTDEIASAWQGKILATFGGNPILMAGMVAALDVMVEEDVPSLATERGARLRQGLEALARRHEWIGDVRGMGLMQGMEIVEDRASKAPAARRGKALLEAARQEGLLIGLGGLNGNVVRLGPSLLIAAGEIDELLERLGRACARMD